MTNEHRGHARDHGHEHPSNLAPLKATVAAGSGEDVVYVSDASADQAERSRQLPDLRDDA